MSVHQVGRFERFRNSEIDKWGVSGDANQRCVQDNSYDILKQSYRTDEEHLLFDFSL